MGSIPYKASVGVGVVISVILGILFVQFFQSEDLDLTYSPLSPNIVPVDVPAIVIAQPTNKPAVSEAVGSFRVKTPKADDVSEAVGSAKTPKADDVPWFKTFRMVGDPMDPVWNHVNEQMRLILKGKIKGIEGVKGAGVDSMPGHAILNIQKITASPAIEAECGFTYTYLAKAAMNGSSPFKEKSTAFEGVAKTHTQALQIIVKSDSGIDSVSDLDGKKLSTGYQPQPDESLTQSVLKKYGISANVENNFFDLGLVKLSEGEVDAISYFVPIGSDEVAKLFKANKLKVLSVDRDVPGISSVVIPSGTYKGVKSDVSTIGSNSIWVCSSELSTEAVKDITGFLVGNIDHFAMERPELTSMTASTASEDIGIPMHPGAEAYYKS